MFRCKTKIHVQKELEAWLYELVCTKAKRENQGGGPHLLACLGYRASSKSASEISFSSSV